MTGENNEISKMYGMDMRRYIAQRLDNMKPGREKDLLRDVMEDIFIPLYSHTEAQYSRLESRIKDEMPLIASAYVIWTTLMPRANANGGCPYLFPMLDEDLQAPALEISAIREGLRKDGEIRLDTVLAQADYLLCREIADSKEVYNGSLKMRGTEFPIGIRLKMSKRYAQCAENLYKLFAANGIPWHTLNAPYIFKMFDVMLVRIDLGGADADSFGKTAAAAVDYTAVYGKYNGHIRKEFVPVWNVSKLKLKSEDFPLAALDKVNYEYVFDLSEEGTEHGYLADYKSTDIAAVRREGNALIVTSPAKKGIMWDIYKVAKRKDYATDVFRHDIMNNAQDDSFAARMIAHYGTVIKSNAELRRILASYDVSEYIVLDSIQVVSGTVDGETYEANNFIKDEIRDQGISKSLLMKFTPLKRNSYIVRDLMSFLVSQTQLIYPEFNCVGVLI